MIDTPNYSHQEITNNDQRYYYDTDLNKYISCTTLLSLYEDKTGLDTWRSKYGEEYCNQYTLDRINEGKHTHSNIERYLADPNIHPEDEEINLDLRSIHAINTFYSKVEPISQEETILYREEDVGFAGTYDQLVYIPDNTFYYKDSLDTLKGGYALADLKTKKRMKDFANPVYSMKHWIQGSAYWHGLEQTTGIKIDHFIVVYTTTRKCKLYCIDRESKDFYWNYFKELLDYHHGKVPEYTGWDDMLKDSEFNYNFETDTSQSYVALEMV